MNTETYNTILLRLKHWTRVRNLDINQYDLINLAELLRKDLESVSAKTERIENYE